MSNSAIFMENSKSQFCRIELSKFLDPCPYLRDLKGIQFCLVFFDL